MFKERTVQSIADEIQERGHGKIPIKSVFETEDPENEDDMIYITDHIQVQVGPDYLLVSNSFRHHLGNKSWEFQITSYSIDEVIKQIYRTMENS